MDLGRKGMEEHSEQTKLSRLASWVKQSSLNTAALRLQPVGGKGMDAGEAAFPGSTRWCIVRKKHLISPRCGRHTAEAGKPEAAGELPPGQCRKPCQDLGEGSPLAA